MNKETKNSPIAEMNGGLNSFLRVTLIQNDLTSNYFEDIKVFGNKALIRVNKNILVKAYLQLDKNYNGIKYNGSYELNGRYIGEELFDSLNLDVIYNGRVIDSAKFMYDDYFQCIEDIDLTFLVVHKKLRALNDKKLSYTFLSVFYEEEIDAEIIKKSIVGNFNNMNADIKNYVEMF